MSGKSLPLTTQYKKSNCDLTQVMDRSGDNGFHGFNIFKDDKHVMYTDGNGNQCRSIYYSLPVSVPSLL